MSQKWIPYDVPYLRLLGHVILQISILHVHRNMSQKWIPYDVPFLRLIGHVILQISTLHVHRNLSQKEIPYDVPYLRLLRHVILKKYQRRVSATTTLPSPVKCKTASRNLLSRDSTLSASSGSPWKRISICYKSLPRGRQEVKCVNQAASLGDIIIILTLSTVWMGLSH